MIHQRHRQTDGHKDGQTTCDRKTALCSIVHRTVKTCETTQTRNPKVICEEPRSHPSRQRITTPRSPRWLQWDVSHLLPKLLLPFNDLHPHLIPRSTPFTSPNGIQIQSAVMPQKNSLYRLTDRQTDRPTDGIDDKSVSTPAYALLIAYRLG